MGISAFSGPLDIAAKGSGKATVLPIAEQRGPSVVFGGVALQDPRFYYVGGDAGPETLSTMVIGMGPAGHLPVMDQAPSTAAVNNIAVAAAVTSGTNMTLVSTTAAGITILATALTVPQSGNVIAAAKLAIDLAPALVSFGRGKSIALADPTKSIARAVSITASSGGAGGAFLVQGADLYGYPQTEKITAASSPSGSTTTNGKKAFKFINAVTPQVTDTKSYSIGTADIFGFPMRVDTFAYSEISWAGTPVVSSAGFTAAVTSTATNTTGDVRGTYAVQSASDGVKPLQIFQTVSPANLSTIAGLFGVVPA